MLVTRSLIMVSAIKINTFCNVGSDLDLNHFVSFKSMFSLSFSNELITKFPLSSVSTKIEKILKQVSNFKQVIFFSLSFFQIQRDLSFVCFYGFLVYRFFCSQNAEMLFYSSILRWKYISTFSNDCWISRLTYIRGNKIYQTHQYELKGTFW